MSSNGWQSTLSLAFLAYSGVLMRKWQCITCGFIYDEAEGYPEEGIAPGTRWEDVPEDWVCPECGTPKDDFDMMEVE